MKVEQMKKVQLIITIFMTSISIVNAQTTQKAGPQSPYTLVYDGAITGNVKGKVNIHPVTYKLNGLDIAANSNWLKKKKLDNN